MKTEFPVRKATLSFSDRSWFFPLWCVVAAFGTYAAMYGFRKPFTAGGYSQAPFPVDFKTWMVVAQVLGYAVSKFIGIKVVSEIEPHRRAVLLLGLIAGAEVALVGFALTPVPWNLAFLFLNGLSLGMVFGLVLGFLEGRRLTEAFAAGLCASFILADGFTKSVGAMLLSAGVPELWMPSVAGAIFVLPLLGFVWMLARIPAPSNEDVSARAARVPMNSADRMTMLMRHAVGLSTLTAAYLVITVLRSLRADFAPELWKSLGYQGQPGLFTQSELLVTLGVVAANGCLVFVVDNRRAFFMGLWISIAGILLGLLALTGLESGFSGGFAFMVLLGLGLYVPYVAVHTTLFERLIAMTRDRGNIGYLMYLADSAGYLGYVLVMVGKTFWRPDGEFLPFFLRTSWVCCGLALVSLLAARWAFARYTTVERGPVRRLAVE